MFNTLRGTRLLRAFLFRARKSIRPPPPPTIRPSIRLDDQEDRKCIFFYERRRRRRRRRYCRPNGEAAAYRRALPEPGKSHVRGGRSAIF